MDDSEKEMTGERVDFMETPGDEGNAGFSMDQQRKETLAGGGQEENKSAEQGADTPTSRTRQFLRNARKDAELKMYALGVPFNLGAAAISTFAFDNPVIGALETVVAAGAAWQAKKVNEEVNYKNTHKKLVDEARRLVIDRNREDIERNKGMVEGRGKNDDQ